MRFADLTDTSFSFRCDVLDFDPVYKKYSEYMYLYYDFTAQDYDTKYIRCLTENDIQILRENCKRILHATELFRGED